MFGGKLLEGLLGGNPLGDRYPGVAPALPPMAGDPIPGGMSDAEVPAAMADSFKPTHRNIFGRLADLWLQAQGQKPVYEGRMQERDMTRAFEGFADDPRAVAGRLAQMGRPDLAMKMFDMTEDNDRADSAQDRLNRIADDKITTLHVDRGLNMLHGADEKSYPEMKQRVEGYWRAKGIVPPFDLPAVFDENAIENLRMGEMSVKQQLDYATRQERLAQQGAATESLIEHRDDSRVIKRERNAVLEEQGETRLQQGQARVNQGERRLEQGDRRLTQTDKKPRVVNTPNGPMELSPSGTTGRIGDQIWQKTGNGKEWKRIK